MAYKLVAVFLAGICLAVCRAGDWSFSTYKRNGAAAILPRTNMGLMDWGSWSSCSVTCGEGVQTRTRKCKYDSVPYMKQNLCAGDHSERRPCEQPSCSDDSGVVDGNWSDFDDGVCSVTCGKGTLTRTRKCNNPAPYYGGKDCAGSATKTEYCERPACPPGKVDGNWSEFDDGVCSVTCGKGTVTRTRKCNNPAPYYGGKDCVGSDTKTEYCERPACPVDGNWSKFDEGVCSVTCGKGTFTRTRECSNPAPSYGGKDCVGSATETEYCQRPACPVDGNWSKFDEGVCSVTCGKGTLTRTRKCNNPAPANGGKECQGFATETEVCTRPACPVDGIWSDFGDGVCLVTCGKGTLTRTRKCNYPAPANGGKDCLGSATKTEMCTRPACPVDGEWSKFDEGVCSVSCGKGTLTRTRECDSPAPANGGKECSGSATKTEVCTRPACPVDGDWSKFDDGVCSVTCGKGILKRTRECNNPAPANGGKECAGSATTTEVCNRPACPVDGNWSDFGDGVCSVTCGKGTLTRTRKCNNPAPANGGKDCAGSTKKTIACTRPACPVDGSWSAFEGGACSVTCGEGEIIRTRKCNNPAPANGGKECSGSATKTEVCKRPDCPVDGSWSNFEDGACSVTCGKGTFARTRKCNNPAPANGGKDCLGSATETKTCERKPCPVDGNWSDFGDGVCSVTCGKGTLTRTRKCNKPAPAYGGKDCSGSKTQTEVCKRPACPVDGNWSDFGDGVCLVTCGKGTLTRTRKCNNPAPANGGKDCTGSAKKTEVCTRPACPVDGNWSDFGDGVCSVTCGKGTLTRTRKCNNPAPANGGKACTGSAKKTEYCKRPACPVDGDWSPFKDGVCSVTCGKGTLTRTRECNNPAPANGGKECPGSATEDMYCKKPDCPVDGNWSPFEDGVCSVTCGKGTLKRTRKCNNPAPANGGKECAGSATEDVYCKKPACPVDGNWSSFKNGLCSVTCGKGKVTRTRLCNNPAPSNGGKDCLGPSKVTEYCHRPSCPKNYGETYGTPIYPRSGSGRRYVIHSNRGSSEVKGHGGKSLEDETSKPSGKKPYGVRQNRRSMAVKGYGGDSGTVRQQPTSSKRYIMRGKGKSSNVEGTLQHKLKELY